MKKILTLLLIVFFKNLSFTQERYFSYIIDSTIQSNKLYKCIIYDKNDSIIFFKKYPNGFYHKYNRNGKCVESNGYLDNTIIKKDYEIINYSIYDNNNTFVSRVTIDSMLNPPVHLTVEILDSTKSILNNYNIYPNNFISQWTSNLNQIRTDTLIQNEKIFSIRYINDSDTSYFYKYSTGNKIDSTIFIGSIYREGKKNNTHDITKTFWKYLNSSISQIDDLHYNDSLLIDKTSTIYYTNNLPKEVRKFFYDKKNKNSIFYGYKYVFYD